MKMEESNKLICYCFGYSEDDVIDDVKRYGRSTIVGKITGTKKNGVCNCEVNNPKKQWCLSDVHRVVETVKKEKLT